MLHRERIHGGILVYARVTLAAIQAACERGREFANQAVVWETEIAQLEREADEVDEEVGGVDAAVDEDGTVDVGVGES
jgi:hypothetical protein